MRAKKFGWTDNNGILIIPPDPATPNVVKNLLDDYGTISYEAILAKEQTYMDTDCRGTQDTHMLYECIMNSLTDEGRAKLNIDDDMYTVGTNERMSGACLLKILIRKSHLDSNATSSMIRFKLSNLDEYLSEIDNDINKFHKYVKVLIDNLHARGETTHDLLANLFKAYAACSDQTFVKYMSDVQTRWEDDEALTPNQLMQKAANKFKILNRKTCGRPHPRKTRRLQHSSHELGILNLLWTPLSSIQLQTPWYFHIYISSIGACGYAKT